MNFDTLAQITEHNRLFKLENQAYFLYKKLTNIYSSDLCDDERYYELAEKAYRRYQRRHNALNSYHQSIGLEI